MFAASMATATGLAVAEGTTMSGTPANDPSGVAGAATPATEAIRRVGAFGTVTGLGSAKLAELLGTLGVKLLKLKASMRANPGAPFPPPGNVLCPPRLPPLTLRMPDPVIVFAISRIAPPDPPPPAAPPPPTLAPVPPNALIVPVKLMVVEL